MYGGIPLVWKNLRYKIISNMCQCYSPTYNDYHQLIFHYTKNYFLLAFFIPFFKTFMFMKQFFKCLLLQVYFSKVIVVQINVRLTV